jgi:hypothetical protein
VTAPCSCRCRAWSCELDSDPYQCVSYFLVWSSGTVNPSRKSDKPGDGGACHFLTPVLYFYLLGPEQWKTPEVNAEAFSPRKLARNLRLRIRPRSEALNNGSASFISRYCLRGY